VSATRGTETFSSRWLMLLTMLSMAVGTGNVWRFPRIAAENGGGAFLVPWIIFLFLWSIPLILVEFGFGRSTRSGPIRAFVLAVGPGWAWMGAFVAFVATAIMFYYAVVAGWTLWYLGAALLGELPGPVPAKFWANYAGTAWPVLTQGISILLGVIVVSRGVRGIETVAKVLMPLLFVLVIAMAVRAVTLPGASDGLKYLFTLRLDALGDARIWIEALTQNAWDTGAGWGLVLAYAAYLRRDEDTALNAFIVPTANNAVSLLAGIMIICTVFSVVPALVANYAGNPAVLEGFPALASAVRDGKALSPELVRETIFQAGNEGLTFVWMPELFARIPLGKALMVLFFAALFFAALTSLIAMIELATRVCIDAGFARRNAIRVVGIAAFVLGLPSALYLPILRNQDWVWAVGLMLSGLFFAVAVIAHGVKNFRQSELNHEHSNIRIGRWWDFVISCIVPAEAVLLTLWWLYQSMQWAGKGWLNPFGVDNVGTVLFQFAIVIVILLFSNKWLATRSCAQRSRE
jgi:NSS family neurotransmitter:Na+ symporter